MNKTELRAMIDRSFSWAESRKLTRTNPVHGEEEAKLILEENFAHEDEHGEMERQQGSADLEDCI